MKLDRCVILVSALVAAGTMGCGSRTSAKPSVCAPAGPTVSTTQLMAAELRDTDDAPKVGKSQHSSSSAPDEDEGKKDVPHRRDDRRPGGGFSGYK